MKINLRLRIGMVFVFAISWPAQISTGLKLPLCLLGRAVLQKGVERATMEGDSFGATHWSSTN